MKFKKLLIGLLSVTVLSFSAFTVFANNNKEITLIKDDHQINHGMPIIGEPDIGEKFVFGSFTGTVKEIRDFEAIDGAKFVSLEDSDGMPANFIVSKDTYVVNQDEIAVGSVITGYYNANSPMILIYPPQYNVEVIVVQNKDYNVKVDMFDNDLVSMDHMLKLNVAEDTEIILTDGTSFKGEITNRKLVVIYGVATKSIPAQTTPIKIIVLPEEKESPITDISNMDIVVNTKKIDALAAYTNSDGNIMVPLRPIARALGFEVKWDNKSQSIMVGKGISLTIGRDYYTYMKTSPIVLGAVPELVDEVTFVPLSFFEEVMKVDHAYVAESEIIIDYMN